VTRTPSEIIQAALQRGAITAERAAWWQSRAEHGEDIGVLDQCAGGIFAPPALGPHAHHATGAVFAAAVHASPVYRQSAPSGVDPSLYSPTPLLDQVQAHRPALAAAAMAENPDPPRLFGTRDLPVATASGIDPSVLAQVPWQARRAVAAARTRADAYELIDKYTDAPAMAATDAAIMAHNDGYVSAFSQWLAGSGSGPEDTAARASAASPYSVEDLHAELFGSQHPG